MADTPKYGSDLGSYKLSVTDTQKARRNFEGFEKNQYYSLADMQQENNKFKEQSGHTETDSKTYPSDNEKSVAAIYKRQGKGKSHGGQKLNLSQPHVPGTKTYG